MKAVVVHGPGDIRYEDMRLTAPGPGEVLIEMKAAGVCSSDLVRALGEGVYLYPIVLGQEMVGEVAALEEG